MFPRLLKILVSFLCYFPLKQTVPHHHLLSNSNKTSRRVIWTCFLENHHMNLIKPKSIGRNEVRKTHPDWLKWRGVYRINISFGKRDITFCGEIHTIFGGPHTISTNDSECFVHPRQKRVGPGVLSKHAQCLSKVDEMKTSFQLRSKAKNFKRKMNSRYGYV